MCFSKKKSVCVRVREITCSEWMTWGWGRRNMYHVWPKASWLWLPSPLFLPRMLTCTLRDSRCVRDPTMVGSTFCRTCEVEGPLYLYSTLLGRGWPCYHVLEGPTDFKGVVLKVWTCGLGGGGVLLTKGDTDTHPIYCSIADFLRFCKLWFVWSGPTLQFSGEITVYF